MSNSSYPTQMLLLGGSRQSRTMFLHTFPLLNGVNTGLWSLFSIFGYTVCNNTNSWFCHCCPANSLIFSTFLSKSNTDFKNPSCISIMLLTEGWDVPQSANLCTCVICVSITPQSYMSRHDMGSQFEAPLHNQHPQSHNTFISQLL